MILKNIDYLFKDVTFQITTKCNLKCPYCFSNNQTRTKDLDFIDYKKSIDFLYENGIRHIKITGGEPFTHKKIYDFINYTTSLNSMFLTVFSNVSTTIQFENINRPEQLTIVSNINDYNFTKNKKQLINVEKLSQIGSSVVLGYNIYEDSFDISPIIELSKNIKAKKIRLGITNKVVYGNNKHISKSNYRVICKNLVKQLKKYESHQVKLFIDCPIPLCFIDEHDREYLEKHADLNGICFPRIILNNNLNIYHCYVTEQIENTNHHLSSYKNLIELKKAALDHYNKINQIIPIPNKCKSCVFYLNSKCTSGCFSCRSF